MKFEPRKLLVNLQEFIQAILDKHLLENYGIKELILFGSFARKEPARDIDILVDGYRSPEDMINLRAELGKLSGLPVDLLLKNFANPIVLTRAKTDFIHVT